MYYRSVAVIGAVICLGLSAGVRAAEPTIAERYARARWMGSSEPNTLVTKANIAPHWLEGGSSFWYRNDVRGTREFLFVDGELGLRRPAFDHAKLAQMLTKETGQNYRAERLPFTSIAFDEENRIVRFKVGAQWWRYDNLSNTLAKADAPKEKPEAPKPRPRPEVPYTVVVRSNNIWIQPNDAQEYAATTDGTDALPYANPEPSPDGRYVTLFRVHPGDRRTMTHIDSIPKNGNLRPTPKTFPYALPGDKVDTYDVLVFDAQTRTLTPLKLETSDWDWFPDIRWKPDNTHFTLDQMFRAHKRQRVLEADAQTGTVRTLIDETSKTFVYPPFRYLRFLDASDEILWTSERNGWNHLYLIDAKTGTVKKQITHGEWVVRGIENVDTEKREIVFAASGLDPKSDPYLVQYYRIGFDGSGWTGLTPADGNHSIRFSPNRKFYLDTYSRVDLPPVTVLRSSRDGILLCPLETADISEWKAQKVPLPEAFRAKGRDGKTDIWGVVYRPSSLDPKRKYPVIENIYAGPQGSFAPKSFSATNGMQAIAELGFIVVQCDGMGTANRSKAFHDVTYENLGDGGYPDRIAWMKALAKKYPYVDVSRVGLYGVSAGGYNTARALLAHPEFYKVGVAMAGNHDHRTDKVWWNEVWMGYPVGKHYVEQSNVTQAAKLQGKLMLVHGELDDNVNPFASTMQLADALIKANKDFDLLLVPGLGHGSNSYIQRRMWDYFVRHLQRVEPPSNFSLADQSGSEVNVTVINTLSRPVTLYWIDGEGEPKRYQTIPAGGKIVQHTFVGHQWEAHTETGSVAWYTASAARKEWRIVE